MLKHIPKQAWGFLTQLFYGIPSQYTWIHTKSSTKEVGLH